MQKTKSWAILLIILSTFLNTFAQILYKFGASKLEMNIIALITNYHLIIGLLTYAISASLLIIALRGGKLSVLYPIFATGYIWVTLSSAYFFGETLNQYKLLGIMFIIIGITLINYNHNNSEALI